MGGIGSSRWGFHSKATTVESCAKIDITTFDRAGLLKPVLSVGTLALGRGIEADFAVAPDGEHGLLLVLQTEGTTWRGTRYTHEQVLHLRFRRPIRGRSRWQFTCPIEPRGRRCGRPAEKLYLPPGEHTFGCRGCFGLTYRSCQQKGRYWTRRRQLLRSAEEVGLTAADVGLDMPEEQAVVLLRELLERRPGEDASRETL